MPLVLLPSTHKAHRIIPKCATPSFYAFTHLVQKYCAAELVRFSFQIDQQAIDVAIELGDATIHERHAVDFNRYLDAFYRKNIATEISHDSVEDDFVRLFQKRKCTSV